MPRLPHLLLALLLLAAGFLLLAPMLTYPFGSDQGAFADVADVIARGGVPYRDVWDIKTPGIYYLFWAVFALLDRSIFSVRLADLLWTLAAAGLLAAIARRLLSLWAGIASAFFFLAFYALGFDFWHTAQCEGFASLPVALAVLLMLAAARRRRLPLAVACGLLIGLAAIIKFTLAPLLLMPLAAALLSPGEPLRSRLTRAAGCLAGCLLTLAATALLLARAGALREMLYTVFTWNSQYGKIQPPASKLLVIPYQIAAFHFGGQYLILKLTSLLAIIGLIELAARRRSLSHWWAVPAWWALSIVGVCAQGKYFAYHWLPVLPPLGLLAAAGLSGVHRVASNRLAANQARAASVALAVPLVACLGAAYGKHFGAAIAYARGRLPAPQYLARFATPPLPGCTGAYFSFSADLAVADYLRAHSRPEDRIFIWGLEPLIYFLADRPPATRFVNDQPLLTPWSPPDWRDQAIRDLKRNRPRFILIVHNDAQPWITLWPGDSASALSNYPALTDLLRREYRPAIRIEDFDLWERHHRGLAGDRHSPRAPAGG
jgi:4-amino-4-deoxy-L-arabinose transferase-like glycosyltransferase